jgi:hypothetical protein
MAKKKKSKSKTKKPEQPPPRRRLRSRPADGIFSDTPMGLIQKMLMKGGYSDDEIWAAVRKTYGLDDSKRGAIIWCRHSLKKRGHEMPPGKKS